MIGAARKALLGRALADAWRDTDVRRGSKLKADALKACRKEKRR